MSINEFIPPQSTTHLQAPTKILTTIGEQQLLLAPQDDFDMFAKMPIKQITIKIWIRV